MNKTNYAKCPFASGANGLTADKGYPVKPDKAPGFIKVKNDFNQRKDYSEGRSTIYDNGKKPEI